jgi:hypothetical protein
MDKRHLEDAAPQPAHNIFRQLETNIQSIKHLHQVNLKTQENCQRDIIFTSLKLNATLINPLELN